MASKEKNSNSEILRHGWGGDLKIRKNYLEQKKLDVQETLENSKKFEFQLDRSDYDLLVEMETRVQSK